MGKIVFFVVYGAIVVVLLSACGMLIHGAGGSSKTSINRVSELLKQATAAQPPRGGQPPDGRWVARMKAECARRERLLAALPPPTTLDGLGPRVQRILAIHRAYARRVSSLPEPRGSAPEAREIKRFNAAQDRALQRVARAARAGDISRATREAVALRELAGRSNPLFLRLGLDRCAFRGSGMPL